MKIQQARLISAIGHGAGDRVVVEGIGLQERAVSGQREAEVVHSWQARSTSTMSPGRISAWMTILTAVEVPLVTKKVCSARRRAPASSCATFQGANGAGAGSRPAGRRGRRGQDNAWAADLRDVLDRAQLKTELPARDWQRAEYSRWSTAAAPGRPRKMGSSNGLKIGQHVEMQTPPRCRAHRSSRARRGGRHRGRV